MVLLVLVSVGMIWIGKTTPVVANVRGPEGLDIRIRRKMALAGILLLTLGGGALTLMNSYTQIKAGHVGVMYSFGDIVGQIDAGPNFIAPWRKVKEESTQTVGHKFPKITAFSAETQDVFVAATLNLNISPAHIQKLYRTVGPNWFATLVEPRVNQFFKDETVKYRSVDIAPNREKVRHDVTVRLADALKSDSITVSDLLIDNIDFDEGFKKSIERKQIASQDALAEEAKIAGAKHIASQKVETAKGDGEAILIRAQKQASANDLLQKSITPTLINYMAIEKLSPNVQVMMLPSGQNMILGQDFMKKVEPTK